MARAAIPRPFIDTPLLSAQRLGLDLTSILAKANLSQEQLQDRQTGLSGSEYARLMTAIWLLTDDEFMGLAPLKSSCGTFAMMCKAIINCSTLEHALHRARRFYSLFPNSPTIKLHKGENLTKLEIIHDQSHDLNHFLSESMLAVWHRFSSWLVGQGIPLISVGCCYSPPAHAALYQELFATPIKFNEDSTYLLMPTKAMSLPISQTPASLRAFLQHSPADFLARPNPHQSTTGKVRQLFRRFPIYALPDLVQSAELLELSTATLRRRLSDEQTSFQKLKDECRLEEVELLLAQPEANIQHIAEHLGFTETSTFHRAFRKWTGITPGEYRRQQGLQTTDDEA